MKISLVILITGIIITTIAVGSFSYSSTNILEKYPETEILFSGVKVEPFSSIAGLVEIDFSRDFFLGARTIPHGQQLILSLVSEEGEEIIVAPIEDIFFENLSGIESGWYKLEITSFSSEPVNVYAVITAHDMRENFESIGDLAGFLMVGMILIFPGLVLILIGGIFIIYKKTRKKNNYHTRGSN